MNVLFVGTGRGSFVMRGQQIGAALGARVTTSPCEEDWRWADVAVLVKHAGLRYAREAHRCHVPILWDVLDCWVQPLHNALNLDEGKDLIAGMAATIKPAAMIAATQRMATDIGGVYIPHHCRIGLTPTPARAQVQIVAYDGQSKYLGRWYKAILTECERRGWTFLINPPRLEQADILVAFRDGKWDGPLCYAWKSGVKYVNALCAGRPILTQHCAALTEVPTYGVTLHSVAELFTGLDAIENIGLREAAALVSHVQKWSVDVIASDYYRPLLERVASRVAA